MTCNKIHSQLNALADNELNAWQAFRVRRHLAACPACAAQFAGIKRLDASVHTWRDAAAPVALEGHIAAALSRVASVPTPPRGLQIVRHTAFAVLCSSVAVGSWLLTSSLSQPTIAFADVERAMDQVQIVSWKSHSIVTDARWHPLDGQKTNSPDYITWLRRSSPATVTIGQPIGFITLTDKRGSLERTAQGNYVVFPPSKQGNKNLAEGIEDIIKGLTQESVGVSSESGHAVYHIAVNLPPQLTTLSGHKRILFASRNTIVLRKIVDRGIIRVPERRHFFDVSTWVDPTTHLVVYREIREWGDKMSGQFNRRQIFISDDFHYNQAPPPGVFDWSPSPGSNVIDVNRLRTGKGLVLYLPKKKTEK